MLLTVILCILAYLVVGIIATTVFECLGLDSMPGLEDWDGPARGMFIAFWPMFIAIHIVCFLMRGPMFIAEGMAQACSKRKSR